MAITTVAELGDTIPTVLEKAQYTRQFKAIMAGLCWNKRKAKGAGSTVNIPYFGEVDAHDLSEGVDMVSSETMEDTNVQVTLKEVGAKIVVTDNLIEDDQEEVKNVAGRMLGEALAKKQDLDLLDEIDAGTTMCGSTATLTMGHLAAGKAFLAGNSTANRGPAPLPYVVVLHPYQSLDLVDVMTPVVAGTSASTSGWQAIGTAFTDDILRNYTIGRLFGMNIVEDGNIALTATAMKGGIFSQGEGGSIILATARNWSIEPERDASLRAWELNCVGRYGTGEYNANWIIELFTDATTPA
jgi:N4-gp56 family major capsid protein